MSQSKENQRYRPSAVSGETELHPGEWEALCERVSQLDLDGRLVEVGTAAGGTLIKMLQAIPEDRHSRVSVVDTFQYFPDHLEIWKANLRQHGFDPERIEVLQGNSEAGLRVLMQRQEVLAFVLVDAGHKLKDVIRDVRYLSLLQVGGLAAFHDYSERFPGVMLAVDTFLKRNPEYQQEAVCGTLIFVRKTGKPLRDEMPAWIIAWMTLRSVGMQWGRSLRKRLPGGARNGR